LEVLPQTRVCIACCRAHGSDIGLRTQRTSLGKTSSLKKNYGDVGGRVYRKEVVQPDELS
jgi:hypothetical protein